MKRVVLLVALLVLALSLSVPAFVTGPSAPADANAEAFNVHEIFSVVADPECPPTSGSGPSGCGG